MTLFDLSGKVAVVTGSTRGIGHAVAVEMARHGARLVISSRRQEACDAVAASIRAEGGEAIGVACNVSSQEQLAALVERAVAEWGRIDVLVSNAAVNPYFGPLSGASEEAYRKTIDTNVGSNIRLCNLCMPIMAEEGGGAVVIISSIAGVRGSGVIGLYSISKAADMALARCLAVEWGPRNVRVNCIAPGVIRTDLSRVRWEDPEQLEKLVATYPLRRIGEPENVAGAAVLLASPAGSFITGQTLFVDGGVTIGGG